MTIAVNDMDDLILPVDAFIRSVGVNRSAPHAIFLGVARRRWVRLPSRARHAWDTLGEACPPAGGGGVL